MKDLRKTIVITSLVVVGFIMPARAEMATTYEALTVANNWINLIIQKKGDWGGAKTAWVDEIKEFKRGRRTLGYFCSVQPKGYIVVSLHKELAPVKAYSATCDLDPESEVGMAELLKDCMERIHNWINEWVKRMNASPDEVMAEILEINYHDSWDRLNVDTMSFQQKLDSEVEPMNYQSPQILLTSSWHQHDPYNRTCPAPPGGDDCTAPRCTVGCVALAGAQIMRYWAWPPWGVESPYSDRYDWRNMPDSVTVASTPAQISAVAELCHEIGIAVGMDYCGGNGCESTAPTYHMEGVYEDHYRYVTGIVKRDRSDYTTADDWFSLIQRELNANRPLQYRILGHSIVCDGWRIVGADKQYHMNYGWDDAFSTWYTLDALHQPGGGTTDDEYLLENIYPAQSLHSAISGTYTRQSFYYRYFNLDATGSSATFNAGQYLQFLPDITVTGTSTTGDYIRFVGTNTNNTLLFTRGNESQGIRIYNGGIRLYQNGSIKFD